VKTPFLLLLTASASFCTHATAQISIPGVSWPEAGIRTDPVEIPTPKADIEGDLRNPGRIPGNIVREFRNAGAELDRLRREASVETNAPILAAWLQQSRNNAIGGASPIPIHIRQRFTGFYDEDVLSRARYKVGDTGAVNLGNLALTYGDRSAIVLVDVIVFANAYDIQNNLALWAHELRHVQQYRDWGVLDFAKRYLRSWNGVENEAESMASSYQNRTNPPIGPYNGGQVVIQQTPASICATAYGSCWMSMAIPRGAQCYCASYNGTFWGQAR